MIQKSQNVPLIKFDQMPFGNFRLHASILLMLGTVKTIFFADFVDETCDLICKARESNLVVAPRDGRGEHGFHLKVTSTNQVRDLIGRGKPSYFTFPFQSEYTALDGPLNQYASLQAWQLRRSSCDRLAAGTSSCS